MDAGLGVVGVQRGMGEYFQVRGVSEVGLEAVDVGTDDAGDGLAVVQAGTAKDPRGGLGDAQRGWRCGGVEKAVVGLTDEIVLRPARRGEVQVFPVTSSGSP